MKGKPYTFRLFLGLFKPKLTRPGVDVAGQVEAVGRNVTEFKPGDEVFGTCRGAFAEYVCTGGSSSVVKSTVIMKPHNVTFEQAASAPVAALTALQGLRDKGQIQPGQHVLINGAAGGVGTFAVQIAKSFGADVTGVCSTRNLDMIQSIGADRVIDYSKEDFTKGGQRYDIVFDCISNHSVSDYRRVLNPQGRYVGVGGAVSRWFIGILAPPVKLLVVSMLVSQKLTVHLAKFNKADLTTIAELMAAGKVNPVIDRRYSLSDVPEAIRYLETRHARGKVIITFE